MNIYQLTLCNGLSSIDKVCRVISTNPYILVTLLVPSILLSCTVPVSEFFKSTLKHNESFHYLLLHWNNSK